MRAIYLLINLLTLFITTSALAQNGEGRPAPAPAGPDTLPVSKCGYTLRRPVPRALMRPLSTDRPDATESAYSVDTGHFQVETDLLRLGRTHFEEKTSEQELGLSHNVDLQVVVESYTIQTEENAETGTRRAGFGDATLRLKRNLWGNDGGPILRLGDNLQLDTGINLTLTNNTPTTYFLGLSFRR